MSAGGPLGAVLLIAGVLGVSGCTTSTPAPQQSHSDSALSAGLPPGFPKAVPLLPGHVVAGSVDGADLHAWVATSDPERGYRDAKRLLVDAGFVLTKDRVATGGGDGQACSTTSSLCVNFTGSDDAVHGETVQYDVFDGSGVVG